MKGIIHQLDYYYSNNYELEWDRLDAFLKQAFNPLVVVIEVTFFITLLQYYEFPAIWSILIGLMIGTGGYMVFIFILHELYDYHIIHYFSKIPFERNNYKFTTWRGKVYKGVDTLYKYRSRIYFRVNHEDGTHTIESIPMRMFASGHHVNANEKTSQVSSIYWRL